MVWVFFDSSKTFFSAEYWLTVLLDRATYFDGGVKSYNRKETRRSLRMATCKFHRQRHPGDALTQAEEGSNRR